MNKKAQFSNTREVILAVIFFVILIYFVLAALGVIPNPADIFKSFINMFY